jgi:hypothetical protein
MAYVENGIGHLETREWVAEFGTEFESSDRLSLSYTDTDEFLPQPFGIASGITLPIGGYDRRAWEPVSPSPNGARSRATCRRSTEPFTDDHQ